MSPRYKCDRRFVGRGKHTHFRKSWKRRAPPKYQSNRGDRPEIKNANFAATFEIEILTNDGLVNAYYQIKRIFSNIMAEPKPLI
jgi:hypothetical protein